MQDYTKCSKPILLYAAPTWGYAAQAHIKKLLTFQNRVIKIITKCPRYTRLIPVQSRFNIQAIYQSITNTTQKFYSTKDHSQNNLISQLGTYSTGFHMKHKRPLNVLSPPK